MKKLTNINHNAENLLDAFKDVDRSQHELLDPLMSFTTQYGFISVLLSSLTGQELHSYSKTVEYLYESLSEKEIVMLLSAVIMDRQGLTPDEFMDEVLASRNESSD